MQDYGEFQIEDDNGRELIITITGYQPAEPDVGIMSGGPTEIMVTDVETGKDIISTLSDATYDKYIERAAEYLWDREDDY